MKKTILAAALLFNFLIQGDLIASMDPPPPVPQDTTIRILIVADTRLSNALIDSAIDFLKDSWANTLYSTSTPTSIQIVNGGMTIPAGATVFSGDPNEQVDKIRLLVETPVIPTVISLRDWHGADVVLGLSFDMDDDCGVAPADNWLGLVTSFSPNENGLDLREANNDYIAVARLTGPVSCQYYLAAHEFAQLLGAGHFEKVFGISQGLLSNSSAWRMSVWGGLKIITAVGAGPDTFDCPSPYINNCVHVDRYSDYSTYGTPDRRNADAIKKTARSVANYRIGLGIPVQPATCADGIDNDDDNFVDSADSDCAVCNEEMCPTTPNPPPTCNATITPTGMIGWVLEVCVPGTTYTKYQVVWSHVCPQQVSYYEVWAAQPTSNPFTLRWLEVPPYTRAIVGGASARMKVKSCGVGGCSGLSSASFLLVDLC